MSEMGNRISNTSMSSVYQAARSGDCQRIQVLLDEMEERRWQLLEWADKKRRTPLIVAAQKGHLNCVIELLRQGANVHHMSQRDFGGSALHEAVYYKWRSNGIVEALLRSGANPFVKNAYDRTVLDLALIENASKDLYTPWLNIFDRYGYFAAELLVKTKFLGEDPAWVSRWVTVVPLYSTSDPGSMQCLRKMMVIYDGFHTRVPLPFIDLKDARADLSPDQFVRVALGDKTTPPAGIASSKSEDAGWYISLDSAQGPEILSRLISAVNDHTETIIEQQLQLPQREESSENLPATEAHSRDPSDPLSGTCEAMQPRSTEDGMHQTSTNVRANVSSHSEGMTTVLQPRRNGDGENINDGVCVVCLDRPHNAGFSHGDSTHYCVCLSCAYLVYLSDRSRCPICRRPIDRIVSEKH